MRSRNCNRNATSARSNRKRIMNIIKKINNWKNDNEDLIGFSCLINKCFVFIQKCDVNIRKLCNWFREKLIDS